MGPSPKERRKAERRAEEPAYPDEGVVRSAMVDHSPWVQNVPKGSMMSLGEVAEEMARRKRKRDAEV